MKKRKQKRIAPVYHTPKAVPDALDCSQRDVVTGKESKTNPLSKKNLSKFEMDIFLGGLDYEPEQHEEQSNE